MDLLRPTVYSGQKLQVSSKVAILKTKSVTITFFLLPLSLSSLFLFLFLFLLSFSFVTMILELLGLKKPAF